MPLLNARKLRKLARDPKLFFADAIENKKRAYENFLKKFKLKKRKGAKSYVIVSAVYNVEKYLDDYFKSIINQRLDFKKNIHIILVDDGSTDTSAKIIKNYQKKYPKNITYIYKENGGQASARNLGLKYIKENFKDKFEWVTFTDPDDFLDSEFFYEIDDFLENNKDEKVVCFCAKQVLYNEHNSSYALHPLHKYKFEQGILVKQISDLSIEIQSATRSLFSLNTINDHCILFRESKYFEDMAFSLDYYNKCSHTNFVVFIPQSIYYIRKRADGSSTMNASSKSEAYYINALRMCLELLNKSYAENSATYLHAQYSVFSMLIYHIRLLVDNAKSIDFLGSELKIEYIKLMHNIFNLIDKEVILNFNASGNTYFYKFGILNTFYSSDLPYRIAYIQDYDCIKEQICIQLYSNLANDIVSIRFDGQEVYPDYEKTITHDFLGKPFALEYRIWVHVPKNAQKNLEIFVNSKRIMIGWQVFSYEISKIRQEFKNGIKNTTGTWLFIDRDIEADDNAERLYRYISKKFPKQKIVFALLKTSQDWDRLHQENFNLVECYSNEFYKIAEKARFFISSHTPQGFKVKLKYGQQFIFLGHGVDSVDISEYFNRLNINLRTSSTHMEIYNLIKSNKRYLLTNKEVVLTGQARHDNLLAYNKTNTKNIFVMFTWRSNLVKDRVVTFERDVKDTFFESKYFNSIKNFLNNTALKSIVDKYGYSVTFVPHLNMMSMLKHIDIPNYIKVEYRENGKTFQKYFQESDLMITDYSSAAFEMAYLNKPVLYYQFDGDEFYTNHTYSKGDFNYQTDGFGPVVSTEDDLLKELENLLKNNCQVKEPYKTNIQNTFAFRDGKCCERIYQAILELDKPYEYKISPEYIYKIANDALAHECFDEAMQRFRHLLQKSCDFDENLANKYLNAAIQANKGYEAGKDLLQNYEISQKGLKLLILKAIINSDKIKKDDIKNLMQIIENLEIKDEQRQDFLFFKLRIYFYLADFTRVNQLKKELMDRFGIKASDINTEIDLMFKALAAFGNDVLIKGEINSLNENNWGGVLTKMIYENKEQIC
ncbi:CDP-glycerol glycerophosphotransferase family protein [Campylobacter gastrosuis]|uniref:CDP-glycerol glycerophosphotransferase family protein n=1 Tax=Campylobacter gastrosuis TaxID=2974576 RepID=A0ABT7HU13_9BACT|nr:CDP-glycerol glycerophosphotransferase family protein [Campylobacter gastrosuis]MDL0089933.1 CDP-glycerol glycerophosphotransferase family protein [Campylobacter gastrosuis]